MKDQYEKLKFLRVGGVSESLLPGCAQQEIAAALDISKQRWSEYATRNDPAPLSEQHAAKLAELYGFEASWPEWLDGDIVSFRERYLAHKKPAAGGTVIFNNQTGHSVDGGSVYNIGQNANVSIVTNS